MAEKPNNNAAFKEALLKFGSTTTPARARALHRYVALLALRKIVKRTPVDTGRARGNWQTTVGKPADGVLEVEDKNGNATIAKGSAVIATVPFADVIVLANNLPYIERLENGYSQRQPEGMVGTTLAELSVLKVKGSA